MWYQSHRVLYLPWQEKPRDDKSCVNWAAWCKLKGFGIQRETWLPCSYICGRRCSSLKIQTQTQWGFLGVSPCVHLMLGEELINASCWLIKLSPHTQLSAALPLDTTLLEVLTIVMISTDFYKYFFVWKLLCSFSHFQQHLKPFGKFVINGEERPNQQKVTNWSVYKTF